MEAISRKNILQSNKFDSEFPDASKVIVLIAFSVMSLVILVSTGIHKIITDNYELGFISIAIGLIITLLSASCICIKRIDLLSASVLAISESSIIILAVTGGVAKTGILWAFIFPLISFFLAGPVVGLVLNILLVIIFGIIFFFPGIPYVVEYSGALKSRFFLSYIFVCLLSFVMEYARCKYHKKSNELIEKLQNTKNRLDSLHEIIPVCSRCRKIRNDAGAWENFEEYITTHSEIEFSHGICPDCIKELYQNEPWFERWKEESGE